MKRKPHSASGLDRLRKAFDLGKGLRLTPQEVAEIVEGISSAVGKQIEAERRIQELEQELEDKDRDFDETCHPFNAPSGNEPDLY